jgi:hypothetical protein
VATGGSDLDPVTQRGDCSFEGRRDRCGVQTVACRTGTDRDAGFGAGALGQEFGPEYFQLSG